MSNVERDEREDAYQHGYRAGVHDERERAVKAGVMRGGEYVVPQQPQGAVDRIKALRRVQACEDPDAGRARDFDNWNAALDAAIAAVRGQ